MGKNDVKPEKMKQEEIEFAQMVRAHKETIYTVCYMFAEDADEVNDLFQEVLINLWSGLSQFRGEARWIHGSTA